MESQQNTEVVGGHADKIKFDGDKLVKETYGTEPMMYRAINGVSLPDDHKLTENQISQVGDLKKWTPKYFSSEGGTIVIENMLTGHEGASIMDLKIGTSSCTLNTKSKGEKGIERAKEKDEKSGSATHGFRITGYDCEGERRSKNDAEMLDSQNYLIQLFMYKGKFNHKAAAYFLDLLTKMLKHFETVNTFEIRGASIFCVFDHEKDHYSAK